MKISAILDNTLIRLVSEVLDGILGLLRLACNIRQSHFISRVLEATPRQIIGPLQGAVSADNTLLEVQDPDKGVAGRNKENSVPLKRDIFLAI